MDIKNFAIAQTYWKQSDPKDSLIFLIVIGVVIAIVIINAIVKKLLSGSSSSSSKTGGSSFSKSSFKKRAIAFGFSNGEADFLDFYAHKLGLSGTGTIFSSREMLSQFMKNCFHYIERNSSTEESAEDQKRKLFLIIEALDARNNSGRKIQDTSQLKANMPLSLVTSKGAHYSTILYQNEDRALLVQPALDAFGEAINFRRGTRIQVFFYTGNHIGFSFNTHSKGLVNYNGKKLLALSHSDNIHSLPTRRNQRTEVHLSSRFSIAHIIVKREKGKTVKTVQVEKQQFPAIIVDISGGGLSIQTMNLVNVGEMIKVEFDLGNGSRYAYASVVRLSKTRRGLVMHLKFVRISSKTANEIRAIVHGYD